MIIFRNSTIPKNNTTTKYSNKHNVKKEVEKKEKEEEEEKEKPHERSVLSLEGAKQPISYLFYTK